MFDEYRKLAYPFAFAGELVVRDLAGTIPSDPKVTEGWLRTKVMDSDDAIRQLVAETVVERGVGVDEAVRLVDELKHLNGFKRDEEGLYYEGRQLKAAVKEAAMVAANEGKITTKGWGNPDNGNFKKGLKAWLPEHIFVMEDRIHLVDPVTQDNITEASYVAQRFVHGRHGSAIQYEEIVETATLGFTIITDHEWDERDWAMIWLTGEQQGIGGSRSQGHGRYTITSWTPMQLDWSAVTDTPDLALL